jgi:hypothetical protein
VTCNTCEQENSHQATSTTTVNDGYFTELQVGLSFADGDAGDEYEFSLYESAAQVGTASAATLTLEAFPDITFWMNGNGSWSSPDYTLHGTQEYSAGDTVGTKSLGASMNTDAKECGTLGLDIPTAGDEFEFTTNIPNIFPNSTSDTLFQGRIGIRWEYVTWDNNESIISFEYDTNNRFRVYMVNSNEIRITWKDNGATTVTCNTTDANLTSADTWMTLELAWDVNTDVLSIYINGSEPSKDAACTSSSLAGWATAVDWFVMGSRFEVGPVDYHIGQVAVSSDKTRDFHELFSTQSICNYPG